MEVLALRHGQSEWNAEGRWQGQADSPLTSLGEQQALFAAQQLLDSGELFDTIASSDLQRAR
ncbi:MAG: phosphoglycerate mutase family protein, partial [Actinomycetota bacterium]|nr:phosphoglycerate mutase family protein [Actinomycetota bacterium]